MGVFDILLSPLDTIQNVQQTGNSLLGSAGNIGKGLSNLLNGPSSILIIGGAIVVVMVVMKK